MSKHTPGPWKTSSDSYPAVGVYGCGYRVAMMTGGELNRDRANARLIASAPSMLHTLVECERVLARLDTLRHLDPEWPILDEVRAQIAKATGEA